MKSISLKLHRPGAATIILCLASAAALIFMPSPPEGVKRGLKALCDVIIPSLFPFMVLCSFMDAAGVTGKISKIISPLMRPLTGRINGAAGVWLSSAVGGYPVGTKTAADMYLRGEITRGEASSLILFCVNPGPAFVVTVIGTVYCNSQIAGAIILASVLISSLICGAFFSHLPQKPGMKLHEKAKIIIPPGQKKEPLPTVFVNSVASASRSMLTVCAFTLIFTCITVTVSAFCKNAALSAVLSALSEVAYGCGELMKPGIIPSNIAVPSAAFIAAFGGVCVHFQIMAIAGECCPRYSVFFFSRFLHGTLSFGLSALLINLVPKKVIATAFYSGGANPSLSGSPAVSAALIFTCILMMIDFNNCTHVKR